jgi:aryl-alcohol dehydrogenase-like predicted oxidoreductase
VSVVSLGSWLTFEHIPHEDGLAVMHAAREAGIDFLDDARYDDHSGTAPIPTGWSEVVFGELFRGAGWVRDDVVVANKAWLEFWPGQSVAEEVGASLDRMGFDRIDLLYTAAPPDGYAMGDLVVDMDALVTAGTVRAWGFLNCAADVLRDACETARDRHLAMPSAVQLPYSVVARDWVEDPAMISVLDEFGVAVVASATLAGGALTGKYRDPFATGRLAGARDAARLDRALAAVQQLDVIGAGVGATPAQLAIAFALLNEHVASVLIGATHPEQIQENAGAAAVLDRLDVDRRTSLREIHC